jgi:hypothetical protein
MNLVWCLRNIRASLENGGAGDPPAPVGDPPTETAASNVAKRPCPLARTVAPVPSGESPDGTGGSPVLPANHFSNTLLVSQVQKMGTAINCATGHRRKANKAHDGNTCFKKVFDLPTTISISLNSFHNADNRAL